MIYMRRWIVFTFLGSAFGASDLVRSAKWQKSSQVKESYSLDSRSLVVSAGGNYGNDKKYKGDLYMESPSSSAHGEVPSMFVAIMTAHSNNLTQRKAVRQAWDAVDGGTGNICYRFVVCHGNNDGDWKAEQQAHNDILFLDCEEGYDKGMLTRKVIATMTAYNAGTRAKDACLHRELFMKTDDDTFVSSATFRQTLLSAKSLNQGGFAATYAGGFKDRNKPTRDPKDKWFEPIETWPSATYPPYMIGGTGYIMGPLLVQLILAEHIADKHVLYNEDAAVGVWISILEQQHIQVNWVKMKVADSFFPELDSEGRPVAFGGLWKAYPYALHHHLSARSISCLAQVQANNDAEANISRCFK